MDTKENTYINNVCTYVIPVNIFTPVLNMFYVFFKKFVSSCQ